MPDNSDIYHGWPSDPGLWRKGDFAWRSRLENFEAFRLVPSAGWGANAVARGGRLLLSILSQFRFVCVDEPTRLRCAQAPSQHWGGLKR